MTALTQVRRPFVVCADDFGIEPGVDAAIVELAQAGRLSATGCLVTSERFPQAAAKLKDLPIDVGLHLNFTEYLGTSGFYVPLGRLIALTYARQISRAVVRQQINSQLDLFEQHVKRTPDFIDGHLHIHQFPVIREELIEAITRRYKTALPWLRDTRPTPMSSSLPFMQRFKAQVIGALGARALVSLARQSGVRVNDGFMGAYDFSRPHPLYLSMLGEWLKHARAHSVLMTHPAQYATEKLAFGNDRVEEYRVLGSQDFAQLLEKYNLTITRLSVESSA